MRRLSRGGPGDLAPATCSASSAKGRDAPQPFPRAAAGGRASGAS